MGEQRDIEDYPRRAYAALTDQKISAPGPRLAKFAEGVLDAVDELDDLEDAEDQLHEIADQSVPVYTADLLRCFTEDVGLAMVASEIGPAYDGGPTVVNIAAGVLYELALDIAQARIEERREDEEVV